MFDSFEVSFFGVEVDLAFDELLKVLEFFEYAGDVRFLGGMPEFVESSWIEGMGIVSVIGVKFTDE